MEKDFNQLSKIYNSSLYDNFYELAKPLNHTFGIDFFGYTLTTSEGYYFQIFNDPEPTCDYYSQDLYRYNVFHRHPENYTSGPLLPNNLGFKDYKVFIFLQFIIKINLINRFN